ncbi:hypothetical protein D1872_266330 [compost metagenome]
MRQGSGMGVHKTNRLHRSKQGGLLAATHHNLDGHTAFEIDFFLELLELCDLSRNKRLIEGIKFLLRHRAVKICRFSFIITGGKIYFTHVNRFFLYDRRSSVIEIKIVFAGQLLNLFRKCRRC